MALRALASVELGRRSRRGGWRSGSTGVVTSTEGGGEVMMTHAPSDRTIGGRTTRSSAPDRNGGGLRHGARAPSPCHLKKARGSHRARGPGATGHWGGLWVHGEPARRTAAADAACGEREDMAVTAGQALWCDVRDSVVVRIVGRAYEGPGRELRAGAGATRREPLGWIAGARCARPARGGSWRRARGTRDRQRRLMGRDRLRRARQ